MSKWEQQIREKKFIANPRNCNYDFELTLGFIIPNRIKKPITSDERCLNNIIKRTKHRLRDHLTNSDLCGYMRESWGIQIQKSKKENTFFDHKGEVTREYKALKEELLRLQKLSLREMALEKKNTIFQIISGLILRLDYIFAFAEKYKR